MEHRLNSKINKAVLFSAATLLLGVSGTASSAIALENPLGDSYYNNPIMPKIDMTNIDLKYKANSGIFTGKNLGNTTFTLTRPDASTVNFSGNFALNAAISNTGVLAGPGSFSFTSSNSMFGFGKDSKGKAIAGTVFSGQLNTFGWSTSNARVEFGSSNFSGWACAQGWCTSSERVFFHMNDNKLDINSGKSSIGNWHNKASGTAVIPVPAAAWLFGSGLVGLAGFARKRKS